MPHLRDTDTSKDALSENIYNEINDLLHCENQVLQDMTVVFMSLFCLIFFFLLTSSHGDLTYIPDDPAHCPHHHHQKKKMMIMVMIFTCTCLAYLFTLSVLTTGLE